MKPRQSALLVLLAAATIAKPSAAQQAPMLSRPLPIDTCAGCFAYLEFPPAVECGGQYEYVEDRPLTRTEAQASRSYPHSPSLENERRDANSAP
jgi:hypothetical protein